MGADVVSCLRRRGGYWLAHNAGFGGLEFA